MSDQEFDIHDLINEAAEQGPDMNEAAAGGGGRKLPEAGNCRVRLVEYVELGVHADTYQGKPRKREMVHFGWELSGPKHTPADGDEPFKITFKLVKSLSEKAHYYKLFKRLNKDGSAKHWAQLLGKGFMAKVVIEEKGEGDQKKVYANLRDGDGYTIKPAFTVDAETDEEIPVNVAKAISPLRCFLWNPPKGLEQMWKSIFIDGKWDDKLDDKGAVVKAGVSKNYFQRTIRSALNYQGSPIQELLFAEGAEIDLPEAEAPERTEENKQAANEDKASKKATVASEDDDPLNAAA